MSRAFLLLGSSIRILKSSCNQNLTANVLKQNLYTQTAQTTKNSQTFVQLRLNLQKSNSSITKKQTFSTSPNRQAIPPILWIFFKPLTKLGAILAGRGFRNWWAALPQMKRELFKQHLIRNKYRYIAGVGGGTTACVIFYQSHLEETPITKRSRFMLFSTEHLTEIEKLEKEQASSLLNQKSQIQNFNSISIKLDFQHIREEHSRRLFTLHKQSPPSCQ
jgi:hypothetical protein